MSASAKVVVQVLLLEAGMEEEIDFDIPAVPTREHRPLLWNYRTERTSRACLYRPGGACEVRIGKHTTASIYYNIRRRIVRRQQHPHSRPSPHWIKKPAFKHSERLDAPPALRLNKDLPPAPPLCHSRGGRARSGAHL
ncbi:hypothetical protein EVAR_81788_1 [Eumeta japonica]|uniref:Uncharacterized protein n=1 Tax=Eumeta variegata TaxID=151549 RepID=A0A4C1UHE5_EUMVA|nr:hypothetical protein EVAR_81788_1 [Eumeta japonica]